MTTMTARALALLLDDSLRLWNVDGRAAADGAGARIAAPGTVLTVRPADPAAWPVRWLVDDGGGRSHACPSVVVLLRVLRDRLAGDRRDARSLRVAAAR